MSLLAASIGLHGVRYRIVVGMRRMVVVVLASTVLAQLAALGVCRQEPSAKAETRDEIEEERRLLYVAMTRAKDGLHLVYPLRRHSVRTPRRRDQAELARRSRFLPESILRDF